MEELFTNNTQGDTLDIENILVEEENMLPRFHNRNAIYLYGVFNSEVAYNITNSNNINVPVILYETPKTALEVLDTTHFNNPEILRFTVDVSIDKNWLGYDELIKENAEIIKDLKVKVDEYKKKCGYIREYDSKNKVIVYTIKDRRRLINVTRV